MHPNATFGSNAFYKCPLTTVTFTQGCSSIPSNIFSGANGPLTNVIIPSSVHTIQSNAFNQATSVTTFIIPASITTLSDFALYQASFTHMVIPSTVTSIGQYVLASCNSLVSAAVYSHTVGVSMFQSSSVLRNVTLGHNVTTIGSQAFYSTTALRNITAFPSKLTTIGTQAFYNTGLYHVVIPATVTNM